MEKSERGLRFCSRSLAIVERSVVDIGGGGGRVAGGGDRRCVGPGRGRG